ncbi:MAG: hypothetical protein PVG03_11095 [Desulfarculaceae bacterium]|jgi:glycine cleavage system H lipoate-binding protein
MPGTTKKGKSPGLPVIFDMTSQQCLWSKAGLAEPRLCHNAFDCISCSFDKAMQRKKNLGWLASGLEEPYSGELWSRERWNSLPWSERKCRHMLSGRVSRKYCVNAFDCASCEYDQMLEASESAPAMAEAQFISAGGFRVPENYYLHQGHTWARVEYGGKVRLGLDDFASSLFGPLDEFRLPRLGEAVRGDGLEIGFSRQGRQARAASPLEGVVVARNPAALDQAAKVTESPYSQGWLLLLEPTRLQRDLKGLMTGQHSVEWMEEEAQRLTEICLGETGVRLAATGGRIIPDIFGMVPGLDWETLTREFLLN